MLNTLYPTNDALIISVNAPFSSRLDCCNSLFRSLSAYIVWKLQCVQNSLSRIAANTAKYSPLCKEAHWLPIEYRCKFKRAMLVYIFVQTAYITFMSELVNRFHSNIIPFQ